MYSKDNLLHYFNKIRDLEDTLIADIVILKNHLDDQKSLDALYKMHKKEADHKNLIDDILILLNSLEDRNR